MGSMKLISIRINAEIVEELDTLILEGYYASRSEVIRTALRDFYLEYFTKEDVPFFQFEEKEEKTGKEMKAKNNR